MKYRELKDQRDAAVARAVEAERLSMKSEFDRVTAEFEAEKTRLIRQHERELTNSYRSGFNDGLDSAFRSVVLQSKNAAVRLRLHDTRQQELFELQREENDEAKVG